MLFNPVRFVYKHFTNKKLKQTSMDLWGEESCRACLIRNDLSTMYDLAVPETMQLFNECSYLNFTLPDDPSESVPQHICNMCYRLCELWQSFRTRCQETDNKLKMDCPGTSKGVVRTLERVVATLEEVVVKLEPDEDVLMVSEKDPLPFHLKKRTLAVKSKMRTALDPLMSPSGTVRKRQPPMDPDTMEWGPGPNELGVWKYFQRNRDRNYAKCMFPGCQKVVHFRYCSTGPLRYHIKTVHGLVLPHKKDDNGQPGQPVETVKPPEESEPEINDNADFEWPQSGDDQKSN